MYVKGKTVVNQLNFLASEKVTSFTQTVDNTNYNVQTDDLGHKIIPAGTIYPTNDAKAIGVTYNEVDVTNGKQPVAVIQEGWLLGQRLPVAPSADAIKAMTTIHFKDIDALTAAQGGQG
ncbi:hypothetical protein KBX49_11145 [Liquorilactobacillus satsumensis]|uniref:hypothetical protein n=1 Tax=Liquorilactobacillus satsumensis TaxID=259059 RepID=UPI0021C3DF36|nr:hypothetical protein [Liquorilactobacillus satsumensis]MCP9358513.1 hypothetical protein [Liquorilactobacillus satsumensis]MCP9372467.1 hypothetical protein [Liquorilactobacillus satsumensis]